MKIDKNIIIGLMLILRPYQSELLDQTRALMRRGVHSILIQSPVGSGKTLLTAFMLKAAAAKGLSSWFCVHRNELLLQSARAFHAVGLPHSLIAAGYRTDSQPLVHIASIPTLARRYDHLRPPQLIVWDECHHLAAKSWAAIARAFPQTFHIGLSATPQRLDGQGLGAHFQAMVQGPSVATLIAQGYLAPYRVYAPPTVTMEGLHLRMGEFIPAETTQLLDRPAIVGSALAHYQRLASGKRALIFACSIQHSQHLVAQFQAAGVRAAHLDGDTDRPQRQETMRRFAQGQLTVLSNVDLFGEGLDIEGIDVVMLLRPTMSEGLYLQQTGRVLRYAAGKTALILDHVGSTLRFGFVDDDRPWSLESKSKHSTNGGPKLAVRLCPACFAAQRPGAVTCRFCGALFPLTPREVAQHEGTLEEIDPALARLERDRQAIRAKQEQGRAQGYEQLVALGKQRGYKQPAAWAHFILRARYAKKQQQQARRLARV